MNNKLQNEGTISFWIKQKENPHFKDPTSNINFMIGKDVGGLYLTILKEQSNLVVTINNPKYGKGKISSDIIEYLNKDLMIAITWKLNRINLFLNGKKVKEVIYDINSIGIKAIIPPESKDLLNLTDLTQKDIEITINQRDRGLLIHGNPLRLAAIHWFEDFSVFSIGHISKSETFGNTMKFEECVISLPLKLYKKLPTGEINSEMEFIHILEIISSSFGVLSKCTKTGEAKYLHVESDWEEDGFYFKNDGNSNLLIQGSFDPEKKKAGYVWVFSFDKYRKWINNQRA